MIVQIADKQFEVPEEVGQVMAQHYNQLMGAQQKLAKLTALTKRVRELQRRYFASRDSLVLKASKAVEAELDLLLGDKKDNAQSELFR